MPKTKTPKADWLNGSPRPPRKSLAQMTPAEQDEAMRKWQEIQDYNFPIQDQLRAAERCIDSCLRQAGLPGDLRGLNRRFTGPTALIAQVDPARSAFVSLHDTKRALAAGDWPRVASRAYLLGVAVEQLRARVNYRTMTAPPKNKNRGAFFALAALIEKQWREKHGGRIPSDGQLYNAIKSDGENVRFIKAGKCQYRRSRGWHDLPSLESFRNQRTKWRKQDITI